MDIRLYKIIVTPKAYNDINQVYQYISENLYAEKSAIRLMKKIEEKIMQLKFNPRMYPIIELSSELKMKYRRIIVDKYAILYTINEKIKTVYISHMYYTEKNYI